MSTVWGTRYRLLVEGLEQQATWLGTEEPRDPAELDELAARLLAGVLRIVRMHAVDQRGRCRSCEFPRRARLIGRGRVHCPVYRALDFAMAQPMDVVWWQLLQDAGGAVNIDVGVAADTGIEAVRHWLDQR